MTRLRSSDSLPVDVRVALTKTPQYAGDPLSMEGTHRHAWSVTGWELAGRAPADDHGPRYVYVLRFAVNGTSSTTFAAATVRPGAEDGAGARFDVVHRSDYDGGCTLTEARAKAASLLLQVPVTA